MGRLQCSFSCGYGCKVTTDGYMMGTRVVATERRRNVFCPAHLHPHPFVFRPKVLSCCRFVVIYHLRTIDGSCYAICAIGKGRDKLPLNPSFHLLRKLPVNALERSSEGERLLSTFESAISRVIG